MFCIQERGTWELSKKECLFQDCNEFIVDSFFLDHGLLGSWNSKIFINFPKILFL